MFTRKPLVALALLVGIGGACCVAQIQKNKAQTAPMSASDRKLQKCEVHGTKLQVGTVEIAYGLMGSPPGYYQAQKRNFPHARSIVMGGCVISATSPKFQQVKFCPQCRAAEKRWGAAHKPTKK